MDVGGRATQEQLPREAALDRRFGLPWPFATLILPCMSSLRFAAPAHPCALGFGL
jgi:hypothetical protein